MTTYRKVNCENCGTIIGEASTAGQAMTMLEAHSSNCKRTIEVDPAEFAKAVEKAQSAKEKAMRRARAITA